MAHDLVIPIVFPDSLIAVNTPAQKVPIPDLLPGIDIFPDAIRIPASKNKLPELGHAGVLFINGSTGTTKYYEYGRYDQAALGLARRVAVPDVTIQGDQVDRRSLARVLATISKKAGQHKRISAAFIEAPGKYADMLSYAKKRVAQNKSKDRDPYTLTGNSCVHFMRSVVEAAGKSTPWMFDPRPNSYIEELRGMYPPLDYKPSKNSLTIGS